jgi:hypothetical protein
MKLRSSLIALACLASFGAANALTPAQVVAERDAGTLKEVRLAGASALRLMVGAYIQSELADPATFDVYYNNSTGSAHRAYAFRTKVAIGTWPVGTAVLITKRDAGGSGQGVGPLLNGGDPTQEHMLVNATCVATANVSPATDIAKPTFTCAGVTPALAHAGFSDVEPSLLEATIHGGSNRKVTDLDAAGFVQNIFGVAVNKKLYLALQKAQGLVAAGATAIDEDEAKQPSLPKSFVTGALTTQLFGSTTAKKGWNLVVPSSVDSNVDNKSVNVCRRVPTSGTQAASNVYFTNNPCGGTANAHTPAPGSLTATPTVLGGLVVRQNSGSGDVEACLRTLDNLSGDGYALGVLGRENNPLPKDASGNLIEDKGYRFVKLSGAAPTRAAAINGDYDFVVESTMQWSKVGANKPTAEQLTLLTKMRNEMGKASVLQRLDADLQNGLIAPPSSFTGAWVNLDAVTRSYTSHTNRASGNSCAPLRMTK